MAVATSTSRRQFDQMLSRLETAGLPISYIRRTAFPTWWNDDIASDDGGLARAIGFIHQLIGVDLDQLWDSDAAIDCPEHGAVLFKSNQGSTLSDFQWARCVGSSAASLALSATSRQIELPSSPTAIRDAILSRGHQCVDLPELLDFLWSHGVPVLHIDDMPSKKMAGMAVNLNGRYAIVLAKNHGYPALSVFDLAHEIGHIINSDLKPGDVLIDEAITSGKEQDPREREATRTGIAVLTGDRDKVFSKPIWTTLARWAVGEGNAARVSPGVVAMNYAFAQNKFALGMDALKKLESGRNPVQIIRQKMLKEIDWEQLTDEESHFLMTTAAKGILDDASVRH